MAAGRRQRNAVVNEQVQGRSRSRCLQTLKYKHLWLLPAFVDPPVHPFNRFRRLVCIFFVACFTVRPPARRPSTKFSTSTNFSTSVSEGTKVFYLWNNAQPTAAPRA